MAQQQGQDGGSSQEDYQKVVGPNIVGSKEEYRLEKKLQAGLFGGVYEAKGLSSNKAFAVKVLHQSEIQKARQADAMEFCEVPLSEIRFKDHMSNSDHLMEVKDHFEDPYCHYIVFELASGGDLLEALKTRPNGFEEREAQFLIGQAAKGLSVLHQRHLAMQDVSLENMLINYHEDGKYQIKICDPGQATIFETDRGDQEVPVEFTGHVGKSFRPPELQLQKPYLASKVDAWCLGWSTFYLLAAQPLFLNANDQDKDWRMFKQGDVKRLFEQKGATKCSKTCVDFILKLMDLDPRRRISIAQALQHEWLTDPSIRPMYENGRTDPSVPSRPTYENGRKAMQPALSSPVKTVYGSGSMVAQSGGGSSVAVGQSGSVQAAASRSTLSPDAGRAARYRNPNTQNGSALNGNQLNGKQPVSPQVTSTASNRAASRGQAPAWKMAPTSRSESPSPGPSAVSSAFAARQQQPAPRAASPFAATGPRDENIARQLGTPRRPDTAARNLAYRGMGGGSTALQSNHNDPLLSLASRTSQYALPTPTNTAQGSDGGNSPTGYGSGMTLLGGGASSGTSLGDGLPSGTGPAPGALRATSGESGRQQKLGSGLGDIGHGSSAGAVQVGGLHAAVGAGSVRTSSPMGHQQPQAFILRAGGTGTTNRGYSPGPGQHMTLGQRTGSPLQQHGNSGVPAVIGATRSTMSGSAIIENGGGGGLYWQSPRPSSPGATVIRSNEVFARGRSSTRASSPSQVAAHSPAPIMNTYAGSNPSSPLMRAVSPVVTNVTSNAGSNRLAWNPAPLSPPPNKRSVSPVPVPVGANPLPRWVA